MIYNSCTMLTNHGPLSARCVVVLACVVPLAGCATPLDVTTDLAVTNVTAGWFDVGEDELGRNKLVPTLSFELANTSDRNLGILQINGVFRRCLVTYTGQPKAVSEVSPADPEAGTCHAEESEWGNAYVRVVGSEGIEPGDAAGPFTIQSNLGYTGEQDREDMFQHRDFVDVKLELYIKHRADQWVKLDEVQIDRRLLTQ